MSWASVCAARMRALLHRHQSERELGDEVQFHQQMLIEDNVKAGMSLDEARSAAQRSLGAVEAMKDEYRDQRTFAFVETTLQDIRYTLRTLRRSPGFTITSVTVLALAIGANTTMFSVLNAVLFRPLPFPSPNELAMLWSESPNQKSREGRTSWQVAEHWRSQSASFSDMAVFDPVSIKLMKDDETEQVSGARVSPNLLPVLGIQPLHGRAFSAEEAEQRDGLALISYRFWQSRFAGSLEAIGKTIMVDGHSSRIIGILPPSAFVTPLDTDVLEPHTLFPDWEARRGVRGINAWFVVGRLRPNVTLEQAQAEMNAVSRRLDEQLPVGLRNRGISIVPLSQQVTGPRFRLVLWMLAAAVLCVLLIAATNVASLSLARAASREREMAIRAALGASRPRIVRQLLVESVTLALLSGLLGLLVATAGLRLVLISQPAALPRINEISLDPQVLGWTLAVCLLTGVVVGLAPVRALSRQNLRQDSRAATGSVAAHRIRRFLVITEFALAIMLLAGAGLLIRSLRAIQDVPPGFKPERVLQMQLASPTFKTGVELANFQIEVIDQLKSLPGVESASIIGNLFIGGSPERIVTTEGDARGDSSPLRFRSDEVSDEFFTTLATPLVKGRFFSIVDRPATDQPRSTPVAIVNEAMARHLWPAGDPIGKRFKIGPEGSPALWFTVVGVVGDMRRQGLELDPIPQMFEPLAQNPSRLVTVLIRTTAADPLTIASSAQAAVRRVDKNTPPYGIATLESRLGAFLTQRRFQTQLLMAFAAIALLMAAIGIYGLIQYSIAQRTHEIGLRMALGAQAGEIFRMIIGEGLKLTLTGMAFGLVGALWLARASSSLLFGISAADPITFGAVSLVLISVAVLACYFPARRAMKVEPLTALRQD